MIEFAMKPADWMKKIDDKDVFSAVFALVFSHNIDGKPFTEEGLKKELADLGDLSSQQQQEAYDLIIAHKD